MNIYKFCKKKGWILRNKYLGCSYLLSFLSSFLPLYWVPMETARGRVNCGSGGCFVSFLALYFSVLAHVFQYMS